MSTLSVHAPSPDTKGVAARPQQGSGPVRRSQPFERVSEQFSRLTPDQQARFFALHAEAIERWRAGRRR